MRRKFYVFPIQHSLFLSPSFAGSLVCLAMNLCQYLTSGKTMHNISKQSSATFIFIIMETKATQKKKTKNKIFTLQNMCSHFSVVLSDRKPLKFSKPKMVTTEHQQQMMSVYASVLSSVLVCTNAVGVCWKRNQNIWHLWLTRVHKVIKSTFEMLESFSSFMAPQNRSSSI